MSHAQQSAYRERPILVHTLFRRRAPFPMKVCRLQDRRPPLEKRRPGVLLVLSGRAGGGWSKRVRTERDVETAFASLRRLGVEILPDAEAARIGPLRRLLARRRG